MEVYGTLDPSAAHEDIFVATRQVCRSGNETSIATHPSLS